MRPALRALVTGCAGFIGSHLTDSLIADGHEVIRVDRREGVDLARDELAELAAPADVVFHLAAEPGVRASWGTRFERYLRNNVLATQRLLEASHGKRFVYTSSSSIYGNAEALPTPETAVPRPISPYGTTKLGGEHLCSAYSGVETVILRLFTVYGPRQRPDMAFHRFCRAALDREPVTVLGDGTQTRDFTYVADAVAGLRAAADAELEPDSVFNLGGGERTSVNRALELIGELSGRELDVIHLEGEAGDARDTAADTSRARRELGFAPRVSLEDGLASQLESLGLGVAPVS